MLLLDKKNSKLIAQANKKFENTFDKVEFLYRKKADEYVIPEIVSESIRITNNDYLPKSMLYAAKVKVFCSQAKTFNLKAKIYRYFAQSISPIAKIDILGVVLANADVTILSNVDRTQHDKYKAYFNEFKKIDGIYNTAVDPLRAVSKINNDLVALRTVFDDDINELRLYFSEKAMMHIEKCENTNAEKTYNAEFERLNFSKQSDLNRCKSSIDKLIYFYTNGFSHNDDIVHSFIMSQFAGTYIDNNPKLDDAVAVISKLINEASSIVEIKKIIDFFSPIFGYARNYLLLREAIIAYENFSASHSNEEIVIKYRKVSNAIADLMTISDKIKRQIFYDKNKKLLKDYEDEILLKIANMQI